MILYAFADTYDATARVDYHDAVLDALRVAAWSSYALYFSSVYHVIDTASVYLDAAFRDVAALADDAIEVIKDALFRVKTTLVAVFNSGGISRRHTGCANCLNAR